MVLRVYKGTVDGTIAYSDYGQSGKITKLDPEDEPNYQIETLGFMTNDVFSKVKEKTKDMFQ